MPKPGHVYILASSFKHLYIGVTSKLESRIWQHKHGTFDNAFTGRYKVNQLVYFETYADVPAAIAREKQLKRRSRMKKVQLIVRANPTWKDLSAEWGQPIQLLGTTNEYGDLSTPLRSGRDDSM